MSISKPLKQPSVSAMSMMSRLCIPDVLKCTNCNLPSASPIYTCEKGHLTCGICRDEQTIRGDSKCHLCKGSPVIRSFHSDLLSRQFCVKTPCRNQDSGCTSQIEAVSLRDHNEICDYRNIQCNIWDDCNENLPLKEAFDHFKTAHDLHLTSSKNKVQLRFATSNLLRNDKKSKESWGLNSVYTFPPELVEFDGHNFIIFATIANLMFSWWIVIVGGQAEANEFKFSTRFLGRKSRSLDHSFKLPVLPFHKFHQFNPYCGNYATVSGSTISNIYCKKIKGGEYEFSIEVKISRADDKKKKPKMDFPIVLVRRLDEKNVKKLNKKEIKLIKFKKECGHVEKKPKLS